MKRKLFSLLILTISSLNADKYYVRHIDGKEIVVINERHEIISRSLNDFIKNLEEGDALLFKRGEYFKIPIKISEKKGITVKDYGSEKLRLPVIDPRAKIPLKNFEEIDLLALKNSQEESVKTLETILNRNRLLLASGIRKKTAESFEAVKKSIYKTLRLKIEKKIEKNTIRVWIDNKEILKANLIEELKCDECKEKIRWSFDHENGYLYIFILDPSISFKEESFVKINPFSLDTLSIEDCENVTVKNLDIRGSKYAIGIRGSSNVLIEKCVIGKYSFSGIDIMRSLSNENRESENIIVRDSLIDSGFKKRYRYLSQRGVQDGVFIVNGAKNCLISNNKILNWGHSGVNLYAPSSAKEVKGNIVSFNLIEGKDISYMHGITVDGKNCSENEISSNVIKNISARNQLNGIRNIFKDNVIYGVKNSPVKLDQGYSCGQGIQLQAYGKENIAFENRIEKNIFRKIEAAAISVIGYENDGLKKNNLFKNNFIAESGTKNKNIAVEILNFSKKDSVKNNAFVLNKFKASSQEPKINYFNDIISVEEFNEKSELIKENKILY